MPPTAQLITEEAKKLNIEHQIEDVPAGKGARIHWLGDRSAKNVLLYFHGGGFSLPPLVGHVLYWNEILKSLESKSVVIAAVEYGLTTEVRYPVQVKQAAECLRFILDKGYDASNVAIGGDSAGASLTLAVLSVILHPLDGVPPLKVDGSLAGVLLVSPWVSFSTESESWETNKDKDSVTATTVHVLAPDYADTHDRNNYSEPALADVAWWRGIPAKSILNVYGGYECFKSHIAEFGEKLVEAGNHVENVECPMHVHIDWIFDVHVGTESGVMATKILEWLSKIF